MTQKTKWLTERTLYRLFFEDKYSVQTIASHFKKPVEIVEDRIRDICLRYKARSELKEKEHPGK